MIRLTLFAALIAGCATPPAEVRRECPPIPELRARASSLERRAHTQNIVRMYAACAGGAHDR